MIFTNRSQAATLLARLLRKKMISADIVVGIARGGVVVSKEISHAFRIPHASLMVKKVGAPQNPEFALGARVPEGQSIDVAGKTVLLTDDGIATGETMKAATLWLREHGVANIIIAVPVAPLEVVKELSGMVNDVIAYQTPSPFGAVGEYYIDFRQVTNET